jgi:hypothetical protein
VLAKGVSWRIARLDKAFSSEAKTRSILLISSFESDFSNLKKFQNGNDFKWTL